MLKSPFLFAVSILVALIQWTGTALAQETDLGLSFELPPVQAQTAEPALRSPSQSSPPTYTHIEIASAELAYTPEPLPPIESENVLTFEASEIAVTGADTSESNVGEPAAIAALESVDLEPPVLTSPDIALTFAADTVSVETLGEGVVGSHTSGSSPLTDASTAAAILDTPGLDDWMFMNGSNSLVARTVGSAEGTRQADGEKTQAYYGHVDPGNGVWNLGTFSYQHAADSPEDADEKQLQRLRRQGLELEAQARELGIELSLEEKLNGLDLANQAPLAALDRGGYIERLAQARRLQMDGDEAILWARTHAYIDPNTRQWNAPGLGNNIHSISQDQERRISAIATTLRTYDTSDINLVALGNLEPVQLPSTYSEETTAVSTSPSLSASRFGGLGSSADTSSLDVPELEVSELEVSFGLPPAEALAPTVTSDIIASLDTAETIAPETIAPEAPLVEAPLIETDTAASEEIAADPHTGDDIGISFDSTENIAVTPSEAPPESPTALELPDTPASDLFAIHPLAASEEVPSTVATIEETPEADLATTELTAEETPEATTTGNDGETTTEEQPREELVQEAAALDEAVQEAVVQEEEDRQSSPEQIRSEEEGDRVSTVSQLDRLLAGITPAESNATQGSSAVESAETEDENDAPSQQEDSTQSFWRTEDRILEAR